MNDRLRQNRESPRESMLQVMVPPALKHQIALRAVNGGVTQRAVVLEALQAIGFKIDDDEIADRRKPR